MDIGLISGPAHPALANAVAERLSVERLACDFARFPDGELHVEIQSSVRGLDVYLLQPIVGQPDLRLVELIFAADACRRAGAERITAVLPYCAYARHDRRARGRESIGARVIAEMLAAGSIDRVVAIDLHSSAIEAVFGVPLEHLTAVPLLADHVKSFLPPNAVLIAPDLGAAKLVDRYSLLLDRPVAVVHKSRSGPETVSIRGVTGDVRGRVPVMCDDMISTGGTVAAAFDAVRKAGALDQLVIVASHGLFVGPALDRLATLPLSRVVVTDSVPQSTARSLPMETVSIAGLLADAISRLNHGESLAHLIAHS